VFYAARGTRPRRHRYFALPRGDIEFCLRRPITIVIASAAKQSILAFHCQTGLLRCARNDVDGFSRTPAFSRWPSHLRQINPTGKISLVPSGKTFLKLTPSCP
jgi:hypothetical protein